MSILTVIYVEKHVLKLGKTNIHIEFLKYFLEWGQAGGDKIICPTLIKFN